MRCDNILIILILLCMKIYVLCKPNGENSDTLSDDSTNTTLNLNLSISAMISNGNVNNNTTLIDNNYFFFGNIQDTGDSGETSQDALNLNNGFYGYRVDSPEGDVECILQRSEHYLSWWIYENGSLRLPNLNRTSMSGFLDLSIQFATESSIFYKVLSFTSQYPNEVIRIMSLAHNLLRKIPSAVLSLTSSLQYLSLADNNFYKIFEEEETTFENFTTFPLMTNLLELDLRNCHMMSLKSSYFVNLPNLRRLFVSHNFFTSIYTNDILSLGNLEHLDISYNIASMNYTTEAESLYLEKGLFEQLPNLRFLDLSHTPLTENSSEAFRHLGINMSQISLCYTNIKYLEKETFSKTNLKVIDLSGNKELYKNLSPYHFQYLEDSLEIFIFRNSNIHGKELFTYLRSLRMLDLRDNEIDSLFPFDFGLLKNLEILDLGNNFISNWNFRLFDENKKIKIINLRNNNITDIKEEMMQDFYETSYLAIGANNYICNCNLRDFIDRATRNTLYRYCSDSNARSKRSNELKNIILSIRDQYDVFQREIRVLSSYYKKSNRNILIPVFEKKMNMLHRNTGISESYNSYSEEEEEIDDLAAIDCDEFDINQRTHMNFDFLLLDYNEDDYKCIQNAEFGYSARFRFDELESCFGEIETTLPPYEGSSDDLNTTTEYPAKEDDFIDDSSNSPNEYVLYNFFFIVPIAIIACLWYWKRKDIIYFLSLFKNTLILSFDADDKTALMFSNRKNSINPFDHFTYDVFVSYSDNDRAWVLDELIPNIENRADINICLHERDFQVGLSILENIIQCMDKSRCLLLVVSESFLKSNWCAFEMHLAQHRLIETRREQLILVLLHDIPRVRRTRTLQYLMRTKTYIMWPNDGKEESKTLFWRRLKKAIVLNDKDSEKNATVKKQRHSIV